jgi:thiol-disulfide isomerase/thioredoxin
MLQQLTSSRLTILLSAALCGAACQGTPVAPGGSSRPTTPTVAEPPHAEPTARDGRATIAAEGAGAELGTPTASVAPSASRLATSGQPAPSLSLPDVETGAPWSLDAGLDPSGESSPKGFLVAFMASWCQYCSQSLPTLVALEQANPDLAVVTVTIDETPDARQAELRKVRGAGLTGPVLAANAETIATWIGPGRSVPRYYFVNHAGIVTAQDKGFGDNVAPMMPKQVARALAD